MELEEVRAPVARPGVAPCDLSRGSNKARPMRAGILCPRYTNAQRAEPILGGVPTQDAVSGGHVATPGLAEHLALVEVDESVLIGPDLMDVHVIEAGLGKLPNRG